jgi:hypothetical protein
MAPDNLINSVTERIFFFTLSNAGYEARVVPVEHGLRLAYQTAYKVVDKAKHASWYRAYNVDVKTHTMLVREIPTDHTSNMQLIEMTLAAAGTPKWVKAHCSLLEAHCSVPAVDRYPLCISSSRVICYISLRRFRYAILDQQCFRHYLTY